MKEKTIEKISYMEKEVKKIEKQQQDDIFG